MEYCNRRTYRLRYSDFDFKDELSLRALLELVQESACMSADELGFGYDDLRPKRLGFLVVNTVGEIHRPIRLGEDVTIETWPLPPRLGVFERHYRVLDGQERPAASLASRWFLVDMDNFAVQFPEKLGEAHAECPYRAERTVQSPVWKIPKLGDTGREVYSLTVTQGHCDHYLHANNARYAEYFMDCFTMEELSSRAVEKFRITYVKQAKEGRQISFFRRDDGNVSILEAHSDGELLTQFSVEFGGRTC